MWSSWEAEIFRDNVAHGGQHGHTASEWQRYYKLKDITHRYSITCPHMSDQYKHISIQLESACSLLLTGCLFSRFALATRSTTTTTIDALKKSKQLKRLIRPLSQPCGRKTAGKQPHRRTEQHQERGFCVGSSPPKNPRVAPLQRSIRTKVQNLSKQLFPQPESQHILFLRVESDTSHSPKADR